MKSMALFAALSAVSLGLAAPVIRAQEPTGDAAKALAPIRVACVGDSITYGSGTAQPAVQSYPAQLSRMLGKGYQLRNFGVGGTTLLEDGDKPYVRQKAYKNALAFKPDVVVILLGTNDSKPQNWKVKDKFVGDYERLIESFSHQTPTPRIYVGYPILVAGQGNYGINEAGVEEAMPMIDRVAADEKATIIDLHATLKGQEALIPDRVHPNVEGAALMAKTVYHALTGKDFEGPVPPPAIEPAPQEPSQVAKP